MASERAKADEENLRQTAFEKGEWANQPPTDLDVDYDLLSGALGTAGSSLMAITAETLLALAFCVGELALALGGKIDDMLTRWETALTSRTPIKRRGKYVGGKSKRPVAIAAHRGGNLRTAELLGILSMISPCLPGAKATTPAIRFPVSKTEGLSAAKARSLSNPTK